MNEKPRSGNTEVDAGTQTLRCKVCGDEVPIPYGLLTWVADVVRAFDKAHSGQGPHPAGRTKFSKPQVVIREHPRGATP